MKLRVYLKDLNPGLQGSCTTALQLLMHIKVYLAMTSLNLNLLHSDRKQITFKSILHCFTVSSNSLQNLLLDYLLFFFCQGLPGLVGAQGPPGPVGPAGNPGIPVSTPLSYSKRDSHKVPSFCLSGLYMFLLNFRFQISN